MHVEDFFRPFQCAGPKVINENTRFTFQDSRASENAEPSYVLRTQQVRLCLHVNFPLFI
jgi:hypothetical protein